MRESFIAVAPPDRACPLRVLLAGASWCDGSYRIVRPVAAVTVVECVLRGRGTVRLDQRVFHPRGGDVYLLPEGRRQEYFSDAEDPWVKLWFNLSGPLVAEVFGAYGLLDTPHFVGCGAEAEALFRRGQSLLRRRRLDAHDAMAPFVMELAVFLARSRAASAGRRLPSAEGAALRNFLEGRVFSATPSLADMGRAIGRSPSQAVRIFRRDFDRTPHAYLLDRKIDTARSLLRHSTRPVKAIAFSLRFPDEYYFSRLFKSRTGRSPSAYRNG